MKKPEKIYDLIVIGGGIVGLATAYKWALAFPEQKICVLEKESEVGSHQTGRNSGVIHSGLYYSPGSMKAKLCVDGRNQMIDFAKEHKIPFEICGKILVATHKEELPYLHKLTENGIQNGVEGLEKLSASEIQEKEPFCTGIEGLDVPGAGIIDYRKVAFELSSLIRSSNTQNTVETGREVNHIEWNGEDWVVGTKNSSFLARRLINCGGLYSDRIAKLAGLKLDTQIVPFRGEYYELNSAAKGMVKNLIYPVPRADFPFLGVHFTRMISGDVECGPNAVFALAREGYHKTDVSLKDLRESLSFSGTQILFKKHWKMGLGEQARSLSKALFLKELQRLMPKLKSEHIRPARAGIRAQVVAKDGSLPADFIIEKGESSLHVLNAPSPAATSSLAIADKIIQEAMRSF